MGGTVAVTIKYKGELKKMARKTGSYTYMFFSPEFLRGDIDTAYRKYVGMFDQMVQDVDTGANEFPMSNVYAHHQSFSPTDYGMVYISLDGKSVFSLQGYDSPSSLPLPSIKEFRHIVEFLDILEVCDDKKVTVPATEYFKGLTEDEIIKKATCVDDPFLFFSEFYIRGWALHTFEETPDGLYDFFSYVRPLLNNDEIASWKDFVMKKFDIAWFDEYDDDPEEVVQARMSEYFNKFKSLEV